MCGICGFVGSEDAQVLDRMRDALVHRGPDDAGSFIDGQVALGHRRLSIIDLAGGSQPMASADNSLIVVFNGEIYNHRPLREDLEARGHRFRTASDTEAILQAYEAYGTDCLEHLDGMFAFVLYDRRRRLLFGARDRYGKKPLYYSRPDRPFRDGLGEVSFAFASELKALRQHPAIASNLRLADEALVSYLLNDYVLGQQRIYQQVSLLGAGCAFLYGLPDSPWPGFREWKYWDIKLQTRRPGRRSAPAEEEAADRVTELLAEAVGKRLAADVPVGALLSGGIDSSAIVALMKRFKPPSQIETFSIGFDDASFDESQYARQVAEHFGVKHYCRHFIAADMLDVLPQVVAMLDEPFADPSILPTSLLCRFARERVTVALGGDGGDELFAGYDPFRAVRAADWYRRLVPAALHRGLALPLAACLPTSDKNMGLQFKLSRFLRGAAERPALRPATWMGAFSLGQLRRLMPDVGLRLAPDQAYAAVQAAYDALLPSTSDSLAHTLDFFQRFYLTDDILLKVDRASMMHSLEVRSPFLDTALAEYVNSLPHHVKYRRGVSKYLLKKALLRRANGSPLVPRNIVLRKKKGFGIPVARWIRHDLRDVFRETLIDDWPAALLPAIERQEIRRLYDAHMNRAENNYKELWALFILALWARQHLVPTSAAAPVASRLSQTGIAVQNH